MILIRTCAQIQGQNQDLGSRTRVDSHSQKSQSGGQNRSFGVRLFQVAHHNPPRVT